MLQWSYNGTELEGDNDKMRITHSGSNTTLSINNVGVEDFGVYNCTVMDNVHLPVSVFGYVNHTGECAIITPCYVTAIMSSLPPYYVTTIVYVIITLTLSLQVSLARMIDYQIFLLS